MAPKTRVRRIPNTAAFLGRPHNFAKRLTMSLGERIRTLRRRRGLTVQGLATACGLSKGFISQVENGRTSPSLSTLVDLARVLSVSPAFLVANGNSAGTHVTRANGRGATSPRGASATLLSDLPQRSLDLYLVEIAPGGAIEGQPLDDSGEQAAHVLAGRVRVTSGSAQTDLGPGDTGHWSDCSGITVANLGAEPAKIVLAALCAAAMSASHGEG